MSFKPCKSADCRNLVDSNSGKQYCSQACRQRAYRLRQQLKGKAPQECHSVSCKNCGRKFPTFNPRQLFCKNSCRVSFHQQQKRLAMKEGILTNE